MGNIGKKGKQNFVPSAALPFELLGTPLGFGGTYYFRSDQVGATVPRKNFSGVENLYYRFYLQNNE